MSEDIDMPQCPSCLQMTLLIALQLLGRGGLPFTGCSCEEALGVQTPLPWADAVPLPHPPPRCFCSGQSCRCWSLRWVGVSDRHQRPQLSPQDHAAGPRRSVHSAQQPLRGALAWGTGLSLGPHCGRGFISECAGRLASRAEGVI